MDVASRRAACISAARDLAKMLKLKASDAKQLELRYVEFGNYMFHQGFTGMKDLTQERLLAAERRGEQRSMRANLTGRP